LPRELNGDRPFVNIVSVDKVHLPSHAPPYSGTIYTAPVFLSHAHLWCLKHLSEQDEHVMTICETSKAHDSYDDRPPQAAHEDDSSLLSHQGNASTTMSSSGGPSASHVFTFDHVYDQASTQNKVRGADQCLADGGEGDGWEGHRKGGTQTRVKQVAARLRGVMNQMD
jgi:hypothetical protein